MASLSVCGAWSARGYTVGWTVSSGPYRGVIRLIQPSLEKDRAIFLVGGRGPHASAGHARVSRLAQDATAAEIRISEADTLPCEVHFTYTISPENIFRWSFEAKVRNPKQPWFHWDFSDGTTAEGRLVQHTFAKEGYHTVRLTLFDGDGCRATHTQQLWISSSKDKNCGYEVQLATVGSELQGRLVPTSSGLPSLKSVRWFLAKTGVTLSQASAFTTLLPGEGTYYVCVQYETENPSCKATRCQLVSVGPSQCMQPALVQFMVNRMCPSFFSPVCGCDGITYPNECTAMAAGISRWWAGECSAMGSNDCIADLKVEPMIIVPDSGYWIRFRNRSVGAYQVVQIDFGDGSPLWVGSAADTVVDHRYSKSGVYRVNMTVWRNNHCVSSTDYIVATDLNGWKGSIGPLFTDYVFPGDANGDRRADSYDLLQIGLGFMRIGPPRPFATTTWAPQFAPNWAHTAVTSANFKHTDTDGNGIINEFDRAAIEKNYVPLEVADSSSTEASVPVWLRFSQDSIVIDPQNPQPLFLSADIYIGNVANPVHHLYGLAFALKYPEYISHNPEVLYSSNSLLGVLGDVLLLTKDIYTRRQLDVGLARKDGKTVSGYGSLARINFSTDFVIIIDVIERSGSLRIPFTVPIVGVRGINAQGQPLALRGAVLDTLWLVLNKTVKSETLVNPTETEVVVHPNPAATHVWIVSNGSVLERIEIFDILGRLMEDHRAAGMHTTRIEVGNWRKGMYMLRIHTTSGVVEKRLIVR
ncbi:MAG: PKD domain-containing protein [Saprospiraceae bacterium]|nr:PKD domain-containing protein [Saprospiraceae bacterium]MDW8485020.1 PKD domain-containing protein [Saprospiraceae bacterium]